MILLQCILYTHLFQFPVHQKPDFHFSHTGNGILLFPYQSFEHPIQHLMNILLYVLKRNDNHYRPLQSSKAVCLLLKEPNEQHQENPHYGLMGLKSHAHKIALMREVFHRP